MAEVAAKKASELTSKGEEAVTRRSEGAVSHHWDPFNWSSPSERRAGFTGGWL